MAEPATAAAAPLAADLIRTPDQRLRVFVSSTLKELAPERRALRAAITRLRLAPVMFEMGARPHPARQLYRAYLAQSNVFVGIYWQSYGWVAPGEEISGLEDEYRLSGALPKLIYVKTPAPEREPRLEALLARIRDDDRASYKTFASPAELRRLVADDLAVLLSEYVAVVQSGDSIPDAAPTAARLPAPPTPLVDREGEVAAVGELLLHGGARLVTLTGPGGIGKSRLALEVAARLESGFADGVRFVELAADGTPDRVAATIAGALGLKESGTRPPLDALTAYLRKRRLLLVIDNFEQVAAAAPLLAEVLAAAPGLQVLVTSRTVLRLSGEHEVGVPPLSLPPAGESQEAASLLRYGAVRLFVERARAANPDFALTAENAGAVAEICRRLDGLPLALELAAARVRILPPQALLARLDSRLGVLTGGARDLPERQRTLRNAIAWSYDLLGVDDRMLFARLGVFEGGFDLQAADAVRGDTAAGAEGSPDIVDALGALVDQSLLRQEERHGEPRFTLLETIREYALERLRETADWREAHDRHAAYYLALAEAAEPALKGPAQLVWLQRLETEHDNLRAALSRFLEQDRIEEAVRLAWGLWLFWWFHGHVEEGGRWMEEILTRSGSLPPYPRARALSGVGVMAFARGDYARAQSLLEQSLPLFREVGDKSGVAGALIIPGQVATFRGEYARAEELLEESLALYREVGDEWDVALVLNFLGVIPLRQGENERAARLFAEGLTVARRVGDRLPIRVSLYNLALVRQAQGDLAGARQLLEEGVALSAEAGDDASVAYDLEGLAALAGQQDQPERAARLFGAAEALWEAVGGVPVYAYAPDRSGHDHTVAAVRSRMDRAAYEAAWAQGRALGRGGAVEYARQKDKEGPVPPREPVLSTSYTGGTS
jgi:predicted ATPase